MDMLIFMHMLMNEIVYNRNSHKTEHEQIQLIIKLYLGMSIELDSQV